jgi:hypothetical protein
MPISLVNVQNIKTKVCGPSDICYKAAAYFCNFLNKSGLRNVAKLVQFLKFLENSKSWDLSTKWPLSSSLERQASCLAVLRPLIRCCDPRHRRASKEGVRPSK